MTNPLCRYKVMYDKMVRPNVASTFPRHVFVRGANLHTNVHDRLGDRDNCFDTTLIHLTERFNGKDVYLIGTMNKSTMLAQRTQKLIREIKPDTVLVQTNKNWWNLSKKLEFVDSQEEFESYHKYLDQYTYSRGLFDYLHATRKFLAYFRFSLYSLCFKWHFRLGADFNIMKPGVEMKFACEEAEKSGANL